MKKLHLIRALQVAEIAVLFGVCMLIYAHTGKVWVALTSGLLAALCIVYGGMVAVLDLKSGLDTAAVVNVTAKDIKQTISLRVKIARSIAPRLWLCAQIMRVAAAVGGVGIVVDVVNEKEVTPSV